MTCPRPDDLARLALRLAAAGLGPERLDLLPSEAGMRKLRTHVAACPPCGERLAAMCEIDAEVRAAREEGEGAPLPPLLRAIPALRLSGRAGGPPAAPGGRPFRDGVPAPPESAFEDGSEGRLVADHGGPEAVAPDLYLHLASPDGLHHVRIRPGESGAIAFLVTAGPPEERAVVGLRWEQRDYLFDGAGQARLPGMPGGDIRLLVQEP